MSSSKTDLEWFHDLVNEVDYKIESAKIDVAVKFDKAMQRKSINRSRLAELISKSAPYITKLLRGEQNLTISSMVTIADALDCDLHIHVAPKQHKVRWLEVIERAERAEPADIRSPATSSTPTSVNVELNSRVA